MGYIYHILTRGIGSVVRCWYQVGRRSPILPFMDELGFFVIWTSMPSALRFDGERWAFLLDRGGLC